ncbi:chlorophyll synthase [Rhodobacter aestuarii]|uniref:Chlorophyll synthase n=1 Tax=Rhodobacter aestuarii TaxID=453582 RepID=A0A1N7ML58_9RHOB|nr:MULTISPECIES: chlorophyll synthase ChlG [Rhodobacter]PTV96688.1 chlorophyll synthase [Rhodobacter aestuarii]SIS86752.1 chlorophyll synthase [Rhodobacter aestuarii]SOB90797.1 chlorophyll synthase [Rhodobacter sp. JA431]
MSAPDSLTTQRTLPEPRAMLRLIKPVTWFPPMWAYLCGAVSSGVAMGANIGVVILGIILAGPIVCGMSQAANDWCDRHVDAINEPDRPIPSGRIPGYWGLYIALIMSALSLVVGWQLGTWGFGATVLGVAAAWAYSVEPVRLKRSGWWGPGLVGIAYEGLPWVTGAAVLLATTGAAPGFPIVLMATLYALGAHGIMTINDFKAIEGDRKLGIKSLPAVYGPEVAAKIACTVMGLAQALVITMLFLFSKPYHAGAVLLLLFGQFWAMSVWMRDPEGKAPWYNGTGVAMYVSGMMITAFAIRGMVI